MYSSMTSKFNIPLLQNLPADIPMCDRKIKRNDQGASLQKLSYQLHN